MGSNEVCCVTHWPFNTHRTLYRALFGCGRMCANWLLNRALLPFNTNEEIFCLTKMVLVFCVMQVGVWGHVVRCVPEL